MSTGGRLNLFQRTMLRWRDLHPYNPVHVVRVPAALVTERLRACIIERLQALGLTGLVVDRRRWRLRFEGGPADVDLVVATASGDPNAELSGTIEREFNRPFPSGERANPFRFIALDEGRAFRIVLVYDHYVASGDSVAQLLIGIAGAYLGVGQQPALLEPASRTYRSVFLRHPWWALRALLGMASTVAAARRACRVHYDPVVDGHNAFTLLPLGSSAHRALLAASRAWGVSVNELLMACMMLALSPLAAQRRGNSRRNELAIASILNMRPDFGAGAEQALSPLLAAFRVAHEVPAGISLRALAQQVHGEVVRTRRNHLYLQSIMALAVSALIWPWLSTTQRHALYAKHFPAWAGITSLNLVSIWARSGTPQAARLDYLRAVPTGPLCALVFAVTRSHDALHIGIAWRRAALSRADVDQVAAGFMHCVGQLPIAGA